MIGSLPTFITDPRPDIYLGDNYLVLDFETTAEDKGSPTNPSNRLVLACWSCSSGHPNPGRHEIRGSEFDMAALVEDVMAADFIVAHNAKFECGWLSRCGVDLTKIIVYDTMIAEYVLGGNQFFLNQLSLDACLARWGLKPKMSIVSKMIKANVPTQDIPFKWLSDYCHEDVRGAEELFNFTRVKLDEMGLLSIMYQRCLLSPALADLELNGMQLDTEAVPKLAKEEEDEYRKVVAEFEEFCGGINPASAPQMRKFIFEDMGFSPPRDHRGKEFRTNGGDLSVESSVLDRLVARTESQRKFLDLRSRFAGLHSNVTKYLRKFQECCDNDDGRLFGVFNQTATRTHRLSSSGTRYRVQFQNFNRVFKPLFTARESGWLVGEADGAQLEFRVAAHLGRDRVALQDIVEGSDIHAYTASVIGVSRQDAKAYTFKPLYGGSSGDEAAQAYFAAFKAKYQGISDTQESWVREVLDTKALRTEWGLIYYWPDVRVEKSGYVKHTTSIYNYPVQAFATAEIIPIALVCAWHRIKSAGLRMFLVNTVHDSIIAELPPEEVEIWHELSKQALIHDVYHIIYKLYRINIAVPLGAGVMVGTHWGGKDAKESEVVYNAPDELWREAAVEAGMI